MLRLALLGLLMLAAPAVGDEPNDPLECRLTAGYFAAVADLIKDNLRIIESTPPRYDGVLKGEALASANAGANAIAQALPVMEVMLIKIRDVSANLEKCSTPAAN